MNETMRHRTIAIKPLEDSRPIARDAFERLLTMSPDGLARAELAASGIPKHTIDALFPYDFGSLIPVVKLLSSRETFQQREEDNDRFWTDLVSLVRYTCEAFSTTVQESMRADHQVVMKNCSEQHTDLHIHLQACMPSHSNASLGADSAIYALMNACWLMNRAKEAEAAGKTLGWDKQNRLFLHVVNSVIPTLRSEKYALTASS